MSKKIFIGGLPLEMNQDDLKNSLAAYSPLLSVKLISDRETGKSRGFAFVELEDGMAETAINELNGASIDSNRLNVSIAKPQGSSDKAGGFKGRDTHSDNRFDGRGSRPSGFSGNRSGRGSGGSSDRGGRNRHTSGRSR